ncbi:sodium-dependent proline transporter-like isoform X2 [Macrobrachium nipponense]|uniref:sodium-dependent proline transporter-like isoform X2 n=1 Tax=Macrobrachium nipponense TaxID=159736 RepID=UPI0030C7E481
MMKVFVHNVKHTIHDSLSLFRKKLKAPLPERGTFKNWWSSVLALISYSVGLGDFWRFPYLCSKHRGVTFLVPYFIAMICIGAPLYFLELALGQYVSLAPTQLFSYLCPALSGVGYGMILILFAVVIYYNIVMAWTLFYLGAGLSFKKPEPWGTCEYQYMPQNCSAEPGGRLVASRYYFEHIVLNQPIGDEVELGANGIQSKMVLALGVAWLLVFVCLAGGIKSTKNVLIFTVFCPYVIMACIWAWTADQSEDRMTYTLPDTFLQLDMNYLLTEISVWNDASTQVIYSLGVAYGGITTIASYNKIDQNILRDTIIVCLFEALTSIGCAYVVFSISYYMSKEFLMVSGNTPELVFVTFPAVVSRMGSGGIWSLLFFFMIFALGFDSQLMMVEALTTALFDEFHILRRRYVAVMAAFCFVLFLLGIPMTLPEGKKIFDMLNVYSSSHSLLLLGFLEVVIVAYVYGLAPPLEIAGTPTRLRTTGLG